MPFITTSVGGDGSGLPGPQGDPGADALWNYVGEYSVGASYAVGDVVTYDGQLWYRFNANGGNVGDTPSPGLWNLLAAKGADGTDASGGLVYLGNYISGNGYIADLAVVRGSDNNLYIAKSNGGLSDPVGNTAEWDIFSNNAAGANTGDITFDGVQIIGGGTASGDGYGLGTIELVPDGNITSDQYAIIDPTSPNHIHIRAGGTIDQSTAELILGGERNKVAVSDSYKSVAITTAAVITNVYVNAHEADTADLIVPETSDIIVGDNIVIAGINYPVTYFSPDPNNTGFSIVRSTGVTFVAGESYLFVRDQGNNNQWTFAPDGTFQGPAMGGVKVLGLLNSGTSDLNFNANDADIYLQAASGAVTIASPEINITSNASPSSLNINTYSGAIVNSHRTSTYAPEDKVVATLGDIEIANNASLQSVRWTPNFTATGLTFTGTGATHPAYNSHYVKQGQLVSFWIAIDLATVTNFGTGQLKVDLPFAPLAGTMNHFSGWVFVDETANPDLAGHIIVNADHLPNTQTLDLHYIKSGGGTNPVLEAILKQGTPVTLTTLTNIYINGTYIAAS